MPKLFKKVLVANRGEIAIRIIRALHEMGIKAVAVYSEADRSSAHISMADEAYLIGAAPSLESYLNIPKILQVASKARVDAIHPGYGFLSENDEFADACEEKGITFVGPTAETMRQLGDKVQSRAMMTQEKIAVVPGSDEPITSFFHAKKIAKGLGYPVVVKASAGGGGKGMRLVKSEKELEKWMEVAKREAKSSFGDETIYLEKHLERPHHVEVQIFGDHQGKIVHLYERECSIQRRHQKVIEETPSPFIDEKTRQKILQTAVRAAKAFHYLNAGTIEFLIDRHKNFYFLEMNTRLQVEHPITEWVTGIDMVKLQIQIAQGFPIPFKQQDVTSRGHAIECRIYAEDPFNNFLPCPGKIQLYRVPQGPFVRLDSHIYQGYEVPIYYDPLIGKLSVYGVTRKEAVQRLTLALKEFVIKGIRTTLTFHRQVTLMPQFVQGTYDTTFIDREFRVPKTRPIQPVRDIVLAIAAVDAYKKIKESAAFIPLERKESAWLKAGRIEAFQRRDFCARRGATK